MTLRRTNGPIAGVCGGLAEEFNIDPTIVRIAFVATSLFLTGLPVLLYAVLAIAVPKETPQLGSGDYRPDNRIGDREVPAAQTVFCPKCGTKNSPESKFCRSCGHQLSTS